jgi:DNA polymerase I
MTRKIALLIDVDTVTKNGKTVIRLILKRKKMFKLYDKEFKPYFYLDTKEEVKPGLNNGIEIVDVSEVKKIVGREEKTLKKITCSDPKEIPILSRMLSSLGKVYENDIKFNRRYLIDNGLKPMNTVEIEYEGKYVKSIKDVGEKLSPDKLNSLAFDIEVYNPNGIPKEDEDPAIIISYANKNTIGAITWRNGNYSINDNEYRNIKVVKNEEEMITEFCNLLEENDRGFVV